MKHREADGCINKAEILGNLGSDPLLKDSIDGGKVVRIGVATRYKYEDKHREEKIGTEWHQIVIRDSVAESFVKFCEKGDTVMFWGSMKMKEWVDKGNVERKMSYIECWKFILIRKKGTRMTPVLKESG